MADTNEKIMSLVAAAIKKTPDVSTAELQAIAAKRYPSVASLSKRQFNARYALQVKRKMPAVRQRAAQRAAAKAAQPEARKTPRAPMRRAAAVAAVALPGTKRGAVAPTADRDAIRYQFLRFASDLTGAEGRHDLVKVLADVDKYVDAVIKVAG